MKLAVTPFAVDDIRALADAGADVFIVGHGTYANRLVRSFDEADIKRACELAHSLGKELIVQVNVIVHNDLLAPLESFLAFIDSIDADGVIFGDLAVYQLARRRGMTNRLFYNPETLNTNYYDPVFWGKQGIQGLFIAKEIPLADMTRIAATSPIKLAIIGHGHLNMFHSRRPLVTNFLEYQGEDYDKYLQARNLRLVEELRDESYPIVQDEHGTHIFRSKPMASFNDLYQLTEHIDLFVIDGMFQNAAYLLDAVRDYRTLLDHEDPEQAKTIALRYAATHDSGFLHKPTVFDVDKEGSR